MTFKLLFQVKYVLSLLFVFLGSILLAGNAVIKGHAPSFKQKEVEFYLYSDYITDTKKQVGYTTISSEGVFNFELGVESIRKIVLQIEDKTTWFFIEPGAVYNVKLSFNEEINKSKIYDKKLSLEFLFPSPNELNQQVKKFNKKIDAFISNNSTLFIKRDGSIEPKIRSFKAKMLKETEKISNDFIKNFITYSIASMENSIDVSYNAKLVKNSFDTKANLYIEYLQEKEIHYNNPEYFFFFKSFFKNEFKKLALEVKGMDIADAINKKGSYISLASSLKKYPFLQDKEFRDVFLLNGLREVYKNKFFSKDNIIKILKEFVHSTNSDEQKAVATNLLNTITHKKLGPGDPAPDFELNSKENNILSLSHFKGRHLYINFWASWNIPSLREMKIMEMLHKKYGNKVSFLSICLDRDFQKMIAFLEKNTNYTWDFAHLGDQKKLLREYGAVTIPTYILIDEDSKIEKIPAPRPGGNVDRSTEENIEKIFFDIKND